MGRDPAASEIGRSRLRGGNDPLRTAGQCRRSIATGLVNAIYPLDRLLDESIALADAISVNSPSAVRAARQLMRLAFNEQAQSGLQAEMERFGQAFGDPDQHEGMKAFVEKRKAMFEDS